MNTLIRSSLAALCAGLLVSVATGSAAAEAGDARRGKTLTYTCLGCHGIDGYRNAYPSYRVPKLGGQSPRYLILALQAYKSGERSHPTMRAQSASLSTEDMQDIAAYIASYGEAEKPDGSSPVAPDAAATCAACHGDNGISLSPEWPNLAGQHKDYLVDSLRQYQMKTVSERKNPIMMGLVAALTPAQVKAIAEYYASQDGLYTTIE